MLLYLSNATDYSIYNRLFNSGKIKSGYQMQKFNNNLISGLSYYDDIIALSALPYVNVKADKIDFTLGKTKFIAIKNVTGKLHKICNLLFLIKEGVRVFRKQKASHVLCDAISLAPCYASLILGFLFKIPVVGIITDLPGVYGVCGSSKRKNVLKRMQMFDSYILLTEQMNELVNPKNKPYLVLEGVCSDQLPELRSKNDKKIVMYAGSLWKDIAGIEYLVKGFVKAKLNDSELHLYGTGELVPWIESIQEKFQNVKYCGCVTNDEIVKKQTEAALLVNPRFSNEEFCKYSFPSKTIEYMASGTPVLMTKLPGVPIEYFDYVYTINEETEDGISKDLKKILCKTNKELDDFGLKARSFVVENKNIKLQCGKIFNFLGI